MRTTLRRLSAAATLFLFSAAPALAQDVRDASGLTATAQEAGFVTATVNLPTLVGNIIGALLALLGMVFVVLIIYAGFNWMIAQDNADKVKASKKTIVNAALGLVIVFSAYFITSFVLQSIDLSLDPVYDQGEIMTCQEEVARGLRNPPCP